MVKWMPSGSTVATCDPIGMFAPVMTMPGTRPAVPPVAKVSAAPVAVAGWLIINVVPFWIPMIVEPAGIPTPVIPMPAERPAVLETVTNLEPALVAPLAKVDCPDSVIRLEASVKTAPESAGPSATTLKLLLS